MRQLLVIGSLALITGLAGCGGGGGGGSGSGGVPSGPPSTPSPSVTPSTTSISVSASPGDAAPTATVVLTLANAPTTGLFIDGEYSDNGLESVDSTTQSATRESLNLHFKRPSSLPNGTYTDTIVLRICNEDPCRTQIVGSPITLNTSYQVSGSGGYSVAASRTSVTRSVLDTELNGTADSVELTITPALPPTEVVFVNAQATNTGLRAANGGFAGSARVALEFKPGSQLAARTYDDVVTVRVCYDANCTRELTGSPLTLTTRLTVSIAPESGLDPLAIRSTTTLAHDVIDAEYSAALDAIVMVSAYPSNALYVHYTATGVERSQPLAKKPTAVSLAPDGLSAAVGHDAFVSVVELANVGQPAAPAPRLLNVSADVFDLVLDGRGKVHAYPRAGVWVVAHSIDVATNVETLGTGTLYSGSHARLHPSGDFVYAADNGLSPSDIAKWNVTSGVAQLMYDSPYHGDYAMCGDLWFSTSGGTIYTACGNTFRSSVTQAQDMTYTGRLVLSTPVPPSGDFMIGALTHNATRGETALIEYDTLGCSSFAGSYPCLTHLAVYDATLLNRLRVHSIPPATVAGASYRQRGLFVFDQANGGRRFLISRLSKYSDPATEYQLSVID